jgi:hypothetical protein
VPSAVRVLVVLGADGDASVAVQTYGVYAVGEQDEIVQADPADGGQGRALRVGGADRARVQQFGGSGMNGKIMRTNHDE